MTSLILACVLSGTFPVDGEVAVSRGTFAVTHTVTHAPVQHVQRKHWTHPGDVRSHLMSEHGYAAWQLVGMSEELMLTMHDQAHENPQSCPGGRCPANRRKR